MNTSHARNWEKSYIHETPQQKTVVKVKQSGWITKGEKIIYAFMSIGLLVAAVYIVTFSSNTDAVNRDVQSLERKITAQQVTNENLLFELKELKRPERIIRIARENGLNIQNAEVKQANLVSVQPR
ncbi:cell division protein FtsL [Lentibacillus saliphilus]|uniref:cell division protein FtsL n=1 Tax=Lentibacillus saliphilus TaxID=2737028 RepID=UPI001C2F1312|nr:cell division protein FtsL [Lentibacillus saliphilus]